MHKQKLFAIFNYILKELPFLLMNIFIISRVCNLRTTMESIIPKLDNSYRQTRKSKHMANKHCFLFEIFFDLQEDLLAQYRSYLTKQEIQLKSSELFKGNTSQIVTILFTLELSQTIEKKRIKGRSFIARRINYGKSIIFGNRSPYWLPNPRL